MSKGKWLFVMVLFLTIGSVTAQEHSKDFWKKLSWSSDTCKCIKNENGVCMQLARTPNPYSRGSGTQFRYLPTCVKDCEPGASLTTEADAQTKKELAHCHVDWKRLRKLNPQWSDPNWTP